MQHIQSHVTGTIRLSPEAAARRAQVKQHPPKDVLVEYHRKPVAAVPEAAPSIPEKAWKAARKFLRDKYPVFAQRLPLCIGIHHTIHDAHPELSKSSIRAFLRNHCAGRGYRLGLKIGTPRFDLAGTPCGVVSEHEAAVATAQSLSEGSRS